MKKKIQRGILVALLMCVAFCVVGTSLAWLQDATTPVVNEFTPSDVTVNLTETGIDEDGKQSFDMIPGHYMDKDPKASVDADSEDCYLFLEVTESESLDDYILYKMNDIWVPMADADNDGFSDNGVYYIVVDTDDEKGVEFEILAGGKTTFQEIDFEWKANQVLTKPTVTRDMMKTLDAEGAIKPTLTFKAYAVQLQKTNVGAEQNFTPAQAWAIAKPTE